MLSANKSTKDILILIVLSYIFFMLGNGILSLTNPDEVFYAQTAKEMIQHKSWVTPYLFGQPQFEKPILLYWFLRISFAIFGVSSFSARFFPALFSAIGIIVVYWLGLIGFKDRQKAFLSSLILMSGGLYIGLGRTVFTDMIFSVFILLSVSGFYWAYTCPEKKNTGMLFFFVFSGLAVLTKGPLGFILPFLTVILFLLVNKDLKFILCKSSLLGFLLFLLIALPWYIFMIKEYGQAFTQEFFYNDHIRRLKEAEHAENDTWYFYPLYMIGSMFPWSVFLIIAFFLLPKYFKDTKNNFFIFLVCWIAVILSVFQVAHSKLVSYIFPLFPALALITGNFISEALVPWAKKPSRMLTGGFLVTLIILLAIPVGVVVGLAKYPAYISSKTPVYFFLAVFLLFISILLLFILRKDFLRAAYALTCTILLPLFMLPLIKADIEPYVSSKKACEYLLENYDVGNAIICSRSVVRGIRYYTGKDVAVPNFYAYDFFSPHPITLLQTDQEIRDFLLKQPVTYCVLKKSLAKRISNIVADDFNCKTLDKIGDQYIIQIERPKS